MIIREAIVIYIYEFKCYYKYSNNKYGKYNNNIKYYIYVEFLFIKTIYG